MQDYWGNTPAHLFMACTAAAFPQEPYPALLQHRLSTVLLCLIRNGADVSTVNVRGDAVTHVGSAFTQSALQLAAAVHSGVATLERPAGEALDEEESGLDVDAEEGAETEMIDSADVAAKPAATEHTAADSVAAAESAVEEAAETDAAAEEVPGFAQDGPETHDTRGEGDTTPAVEAHAAEAAAEVAVTDAAAEAAEADVTDAAATAAAADAVGEECTVEADEPLAAATEGAVEAADAAVAEEA